MSEENKTLPHFTLHGRRWFDRVNGNTYHTVECFKNSVFLFKTPTSHGYGDQYRYTGIAELMERGEIPHSNNYSSWHYKDQILFVVSDVTRKKTYRSKKLCYALYFPAMQKIQKSTTFILKVTNLYIYLLINTSF